MKNDFLTMIEQADTIAITGHVRPDGDCVGSTVGLYNYIISNYDKQVQIYLEEFSKDFLFLHDANKISHTPTDQVYDLCIARWIVVIRKDREIFFRSLNMRSVQCVWIIISPIRDLVRYAMWMKKRVPRQKHFIS